MFLQAWIGLVHLVYRFVVCCRFVVMVHCSSNGLCGCAGLFSVTGLLQWSVASQVHAWWIVAGLCGLAA